VLVADRNGLLIVDFGKRSSEPLLRKGKGPGEYSIPVSLVAHGRDSTLLVNSLSRRCIWIADMPNPTTVPQDDPLLELTAAGVTAADTLGHFYGGCGRLRDSQCICKYNRARPRADTVAKLRELRRPRIVIRSSDPAAVAAALKTKRMQLDSYELDAIFPDGWLAAVRLEPYRVDWRRPDGKWIAGSPLSFAQIQVTEAEKTLTMSRLAAATGQTKASDPSEYDWPATVPPFERGARAFADPQGNVVIERVPTIANPEPFYDVVNRGASSSDA
jgi:hypothetical protein